MKQAIAVLMFVVLVAGSTQAQVGFGITGGVNLANVGGADAVTGSKNLTGFAGGVYLDLGIPFFISVQPEVLYSMKGYKADASFTIGANTVSVNQTVNLNYIEVPVLLKFSFPVPALKPTLFAGPSMGILLSAKAKVDITGQPSQDQDIKSLTTSTDWGVVVGASAHIAVVTVSARYTLGLTTLDKTGGTKAYNRVLSFMLEVPM